MLINLIVSKSLSHGFLLNGPPRARFWDAEGLKVPVLPKDPPSLYLSRPPSKPSSLRFPGSVRKARLPWPRVLSLGTPAERPQSQFFTPCEVTPPSSLGEGQMAGGGQLTWGDSGAAGGGAFSCR